MRKHFSNYIKGFPGASIFRQKLVTAPGLAEMRSALNEFMEAAQKVEFELV
jgi:tRNA-dihydrouridine synthase